MADEGLPVQAATRVLRVSESRYYRWRNHSASARSLRHAFLTEVIGALHNCLLRGLFLHLPYPAHVVSRSAQVAGAMHWRRQDGFELLFRASSPQQGTVIHSDHGVQCTFWAFTKRTPDSGLVPSMGSVGDCYDNAMMESFWGRMQTELFNRQRWHTRPELTNAIFKYLEIFHNRQRRHSALGMLTPIEYELRGPILKTVA
jgi:Integrase core domain